MPSQYTDSHIHIPLPYMHRHTHIESNTLATYNYHTFTHICIHVHVYIHLIPSIPPKPIYMHAHSYIRLRKFCGYIGWDFIVLVTSAVNLAVCFRSRLVIFLNMVVNRLPVHSIFSWRLCKRGIITEGSSTTHTFALTKHFYGISALREIFNFGPHPTQNLWSLPTPVSVSRESEHFFFLFINEFASEVLLLTILLFIRKYLQFYLSLS